MELFGVTISQSSPDEVLAQVGSFLNEPKFHRIATVNPEFLVLAEKNPEFKQALLAADLCVADGIGIVLAGCFQRKRITRFPGVDLLHEILTLAERDGYEVSLAIRKDGLSSYEEIRAALLKKYPRLVVTGKDYTVQSITSPSLIPYPASPIIICNFGAPDQELFLESIRNNSGEVRLVLGVGGAFDYLTGKQKRAPKWLRAIGLEWLWRLTLQPRRWKRIWNAVVVFPWLVFRSWQNARKRL